MMKTSLTLLALAIGAIASPLKCRDTTLILEAEDATLTDAEVLTELNGFSGTGYVGRFEAATSTATFSVTVNETTLYDVSIAYAAIFGDKYTRLVLNGGATSEVHLPPSETWATAAAGQLLLEPGVNEIDIVGHWGW